MTKITRGWPPERRTKQAQNIRKTKPWLKNTGPRTPEGKAAIRDNAYRHGLYSAEFTEIRALLQAQARFLKTVVKDL